MATKRDRLPQLGGGLFLTDGGIESVLIFQEGRDLPEFAAFDLLKDEAGRTALHKYFNPYIDIAHQYGVGLVLESATWRANPYWGAKIGYTEAALIDANRVAIEMCEQIREQHETPDSPMVISGCIGPRDDGYQPATLMTPTESEEYHMLQVETFADTAADFVSALTMTHVGEAVGIVRAAQAAAIPVMISFTVETDGRLPSGQPLAEAIQEVDDQTDGAAAYFMVNCAHPTHFADSLEGDGWVRRLRGFRANASRLSHDELDEATELDDGDPVELGQQYRELKAKHPHINVLGGCCGTDHRHIEEICKACLDFWR